MKENKVIVFANQKGGVGKTTLCVLFANYLVEKGKKVVVVDCDLQQSIEAQRKSDKEKYKDKPAPYQVQSFDISRLENVDRLMNVSKELDGVVLFDSPGAMVQEGLSPMFQKADFIVTPYQYEKTCIKSTVTFIKFLDHIKNLAKMEGNPSKAIVLFVPNRHDKRFGTTEELTLWKKTDDIFGTLGTVTPKVDYKASMQRYNTYEILKEQENCVMPAFDFMFKEIFKKK